MKIFFFLIVQLIAAQSVLVTSVEKCAKKTNFKFCAAGNDVSVTPNETTGWCCIEDS
jgi:hypothetical protein